MSSNMTTRATYTPKGVVVTFYGPSGGFNWLVPEWMTIAAIERYTRELEQFLT